MLGHTKNAAVNVSSAGSEYVFKGTPFIKNIRTGLTRWSGCATSLIHSGGKSITTPSQRAKYKPLFSVCYASSLCLIHRAGESVIAYSC